MYKSLAGLATAAVLSIAAMPTAPANAAPIQNAPGLTEHQSGVEQVQYRYHRRYYRGYYGPRRFYGGGPYYRGYYGYGGPYAYAPYPYYRRHYYYGGPHVRIGPFGFGVW